MHSENIIPQLNGKRARLHMLSQYIYTSPFSKLQLVTTDESLVNLTFISENKKNTITNKNQLLKYIIEQLDAWFAKKTTHFDIPLSFEGTDFQRQVWQCLQTIPYGETWSYSDLAQAIGNPKAVRAVGSANGRNPISIIIPCHRVISKDRTLGGYGGGLTRKQWLLEHEGVQIENGKASNTGII